MITGGVKFFDQNFAWAALGGAIADTLGNSGVTKDYAIDKSRITHLRTAGSDDTTTETYTLTFPSRTIDRIILVDHNWKQFTVKYWNGSAFADFTNVLGLDGSLVGGISETAFADTSAYYEVDEVTTTKLEVTVTKTQVVDDQKYIRSIIATAELGTLQGFPQLDPLLTRSPREQLMLSGKSIVEKSTEAFQLSLDFSEYPSASTYTPDLDLMIALFNRDTPFHVWPCGARRGTDYFRYPLPGVGLDDIYYVQLMSDLQSLFPQGIYTSTVGLGVLSFKEHV